MFGVALVLVPCASAAQQLPVYRQSAAILVNETHGARLHSLTAVERRALQEQTKRKDHRYVGAIIGGVLFGGLAFLASEGLCDERSCTGRSVLAGLGWGAAGAIAGALIGAAIPRGSVPESRPPGQQ